MADVTDQTFTTDVIERSKTVPVVVDLWAEWCGPCRTLTPILEKVIGETRGLVELAKVNVDENPQISQAFQVQSIPAVYALKDGQVVDGFMGAQPEAQVVEFVQRLLDGATPPEDSGAETEPEEPEEEAEPWPDPPADLEDQLVALLADVKADDAARERYLELLELFHPEDPRINTFRRRLATTLY